MNTLSVVKLNVVHPVPSAPGHSQKNEIGPRAADCQSKQSKLKFVKDFLCHSIVLCKTCNKCSQCCHKSTCRGKTSKLLEKLADLGAGPKAVQILKEGYTLPFRTRPNLSRTPTVISCYGNPHRNPSLLEALHQLMDKNAIELVHKQNSLGFFNRLFLVPKPNNKWRPILDLSNLNPFLKALAVEQDIKQQIKINKSRRKNSRWRHRKPSGHPSNKGSGSLQ